MATATKPEDTHEGRRSTKGQFLGLAVLAAVLFGVGGVAVALGPCESDASPLALFLIALGGVCVAFFVGFSWRDARRRRGRETGAVDRVAVPTVAVLAGGAAMVVVPTAIFVVVSILAGLPCW